jgi:hypothetical protein
LKQRNPHHSTGKSLVQVPESGHREPDGPVGLQEQPGRLTLREAIEQACVEPLNPRRPCQCRLGTRVQFGQPRQDFDSHQVPSDPLIGIRRVFTPGLPSFLEPVSKFLAAFLKERTDAVAGQRRHPGQPARPGASGKTENHRLCLVRAGVGERNPTRARVRRDAFEEVEPGVPCGYLD